MFPCYSSQLDVAQRQKNENFNARKFCQKVYAILLQVVITSYEIHRSVQHLHEQNQKRIYIFYKHDLRQSSPEVLFVFRQ